jgi:hypothetical protein
MSGAYVAKAPVYPLDIKPTGWNILWPFLIPPEAGTLPVGSDTSNVVAPDPPGYDPQYTLSMGAV